MNIEFQTRRELFCCPGVDDETGKKPGFVLIQATF